MTDANKSLAAASGTVTGTSIVDQILGEMSTSDDPKRRAEVRDIVAGFAEKVLDGELVFKKDTESSVKARMKQLDALISAQLNEVMHAPEFQKLEATWRGLHYLVDQSETGTGLKIRVMNARKEDLIKDFDRASEFDQSAIFKKVYEEEYGTLGGAPYGMLIGDYEFGKGPQDVELLEKMSQVAAAAHAPFISAASAEMFGLTTFERIGDRRDLAVGFEGVEYAKWKSFRNSDDSRYVGLCLPHVLLRLPYGKETVPVEAFDFAEDVNGTDHRKYLWGNAAYALGARITAAFARDGWCTAIRGVENGGMVEGLPTHTFSTDSGEVALKCPTEIALSERRDNELSELGFISLVHAKNTDYAVFFATQSANKPTKFGPKEAAANANAQLSARLQYMFAVSRFAHYLKSMMRDKVGRFMTRKNCEDFLNRWITQYVLLSDDASDEEKARFPLREARIEVEDVPGKPGAYRAIAFLKPHFQLEQIDVSLRLVADLPTPRK